MWQGVNFFPNISQMKISCKETAFPTLVPNSNRQHSLWHHILFLVCLDVFSPSCILYFSRTASLFGSLKCGSWSACLVRSRVRMAAFHSHLFKWTAIKEKSHSSAFLANQTCQLWTHPNAEVSNFPLLKLCLLASRVQVLCCQKEWELLP